MARKSKTTSSRKSPAIDRSIPEIDEASRNAELARTVTRPSVQGALTLQVYGKGFGDLDAFALMDALGEQIQAANDGDMGRAEGMLITQAHTLDAMFNNLARRAINASSLDNLDRYLKLSLRAQSQCRSTWEAVSTIKNPPVMGYVNQANIAHGPQQVNNATAASAGGSRAGENPNLQNKLLEEKDGERLDPGTTCSPGRDDPAMATVGEVDRAENRRG